MSGTKHDTGKAPISLIPHESLLGTAEVLAFGAKKYSANNWRGGFEWSRLMDAAMRHLVAFNSGQDLDPESGLSHIDHAAACIAFLQAHIKSGLGTDNRYKKPEAKAQVPFDPAQYIVTSPCVPGPNESKGTRVTVIPARAKSDQSDFYDLPVGEVYTIEACDGNNLSLQERPEIAGYYRDRFHVVR